MTMMRCSTVSLSARGSVMMSLDTCTSRVCPSRCARSTACSGHQPQTAQHLQLKMHLLMPSMFFILCGTLTAFSWAGGSMLGRAEALNNMTVKPHCHFIANHAEGLEPTQLHLRP